MDGDSRKKIEVLYFKGCPNHQDTVACVRDVVGMLGVDATVEEIEVRDVEEAERLRFLGSPSVRVDGIDIEPAARGCSHYAYACRTYGSSRLPARELLASALAGAASGEAAHPMGHVQIADDRYQPQPRS